MVSPIKIAKTTGNYNESPDSLLPTSFLPSSTISTSVNNLLSSKQLEPVQVHSIVSSVGQQTTKQSSVIQSISVKTLLNNSQSSPSNTNTSQLSDEIRLTLYIRSIIFIYFHVSFSTTMIIQSPRKKRDFYGKSSNLSTKTTSSFYNESHRLMNTIDSSSPTNNRPSSTPACLTTIHTPPLPDRPVSIPPLRT